MQVSVWSTMPSDERGVPAGRVQHHDHLGALSHHRLDESPDDHDVVVEIRTLLGGASIGREIGGDGRVALPLQAARDGRPCAAVGIPERRHDDDDRLRARHGPGGAERTTRAMRRPGGVDCWLLRPRPSRTTTGPANLPRGLGSGKMAGGRARNPIARRSERSLRASRRGT